MDSVVFEVFILKSKSSLGKLSRLCISIIHISKFKLHGLTLFKNYAEVENFSNKWLIYLDPD